MSLRGFTSIVTGASRGIGRAISELFAREGSDLVLVARKEVPLRDVSRLLSDRYRVKTIYVPCDVSDPECARRSVEIALSAFGKIDVLVNNAGVAFRKYFHEHTIDEINRIIDVNVKGLMYFTLYAVRAMMRQRRGVIVNISSGAGKVGVPELSVYSASKFAVVGFTEAIAEELSRFGIRVYAVCPGGVDTDMHRSLFPEHKHWMLLRPEEVAELVLRLVLGEGEVGRCHEIYRLA